jgi:NAD(P)-dependent dehydrogenase (short-subunit alcohol dehydrogenase family)
VSDARPAPDVAVRRRFAGKTVIVTGASRGQGAEEARAFAAAGARVLLCDILDDLGAEVAAEIVEAGGNAEYRHLDVSDQGQWEALVAGLRAEGDGLHVVVNNAGLTHRRGRIMESDLDDWDRLIAVNLKGALLGIKTTAELIRDSGGGSIVNIGSVAALTAHFAATYSVTKWAVRGLTKAAALELVDWGIRVNTIHPGIVETPVVAESQDFVAAMRNNTPMGRTGEASEIAAAVLFLASDEASFITGVDLSVDGGFTDVAPYWRVARDVLAQPDASW